MRALISKYVDFDALKASPIRLLVGAVNVTTAELEVFDSHVDDLTPDHLLASGRRARCQGGAPAGRKCPLDSGGRCVVT
jgi:hypothetical protein